MNKHTPGPWHLDGLAIRAPNKFHIASVHMDAYARGKEGRESFEYTEANARLIALAPEMAEALRACVVRMEFADKHIDCTSELEHARAILSRLEAK